MNPTLTCASPNRLSGNDVLLPPTALARRGSADDKVSLLAADMRKAQTSRRLPTTEPLMRPPVILATSNAPFVLLGSNTRPDARDDKRDDIREMRPVPRKPGLASALIMRPFPAEPSFAQLTTQLMSLDEARHRSRNGNRDAIKILLAELKTFEETFARLRNVDIAQVRIDDRPQVSLKRLLYLWATFDIEGQFLADVLGERAIKETRHQPDERRRWLSAIPCLEARWQPTTAYRALCNAARDVVSIKGPQTRSRFVTKFAKYLAAPPAALDQAFLKWHRNHLLPSLEKCLSTVAHLMEEGRLSLEELDIALVKEAQNARRLATGRDEAANTGIPKVEVSYPEFSPTASVYLENWSRHRYDTKRQERVSAFIDKLLGMPTAALIFDDVTYAEFDYMLKYPGFDKHLLNALDLVRARKNYFPERQHTCSEWLNTTHLSEDDLAAAIAHIEILARLTDISQYATPDLESRIDYPSMNGLFDRFATDTSISSERVGIFCRSARETLAWVTRHTSTPKQAHAVLDSLLSNDYTDQKTASVLNRMTTSFGKSPPNIKALKRILTRDSDHPSAMNYSMMRLMR